MPFPAHIGTGLIVGAFESWVLDGSDPDALPDRKPMVGLQITITPSVTGGLIRNETDGTLVTIEPLRVTTNADGVLGYYETEGDEGSWHTGVRAVSPQDDQLVPSGWTYRVEIRTAGNVRLADFSITFPPAAVFDLAKEAPVPPSPGTAVAEWERVRAEVAAEAAAAVAEAEAARDQAEVFAATTVELQDGAIAQAITTPGSETRTQLNASIDALVPLLTHRSGTDRIAALRDFKSGSLRVAAVGDSTWNDGDEMPRIVCREFGSTLPATIRRTYKTWNDATQTFNATVVDNAGSGGSGGSGGVEVSDDFNRTVADLVGTAAPSGAIWAGSAASWSADGAAAVPSGQGGLSVQHSVKDCTATVTVNVITESTTVGNFRVYLGGNIATLGANGIWAQLGVSATGLASFSLWKTVGGTSTKLGATSFETGLTSNSPTVQTAVIELEIAIQNVTATLTVAGETPVVINGSVTETDYGTLGPHAGVFVQTGGVPLYTVDSILIESPVAPSTVDEFAFVNAATAGKTLAYHTARVDEMFPAASPVDVLLVTDGHNHGSASPSTFLTGVTDFLAAFAVNHPDAAIVFVSQNPEFAPAGNVAAHAARQRALRDWAQANGHEYLPVFEAFAAQPDGGASLVSPDGIHPTTPPWPYTAWSGSRLTADKLLDAINARSN